MDKPQYHLSGENLAAVFEEWQRRWQENPDDFSSAEEHFARPPASYGEAAARYFTKLVKEVLTPDGETPVIQ